MQLWSSLTPHTKLFVHATLVILDTAYNLSVHATLATLDTAYKAVCTCNSGHP